MLSVPVDELQPGMVLARAIPNPQRVQDDLLKPSYALTDEMIERINDLGVRAVWIDYPDLKFLDDVLDSPVFGQQRELAVNIKQGIGAAQKDTVQRIDIQRYRKSLHTMVNSILEQRIGFALLQRMEIQNDAIVSHCVTVAYLSIMLGMKLDAYLIRERRRLAPHEAKNLTDLGLGAMMHDIGYVAGELAWPVFERKLDADQKALYHNHPRIGYEMLKDRVPANTAHIILNHHQRFDGGGFPKIGDEQESAIGKQVSVLSRVVAICNAFDRLAGSREKRMPTVKVLAAMRHGYQGWFDPEIESAFYDIVPPFEIGSNVTLSDGRRAVVIGFKAAAPTRPEVQIFTEKDALAVRRPAASTDENAAEGAEAGPRPAPKKIDLANVDPQYLSIHSIDGEDVSKYVAALELAPQPT